MDSLFVFRGVFNIVYKYSADQAEGQEIKDYDYAYCRESDVTSGMYIISFSTQDSSKDELQYHLS